jgi:hypothetical protein
MELNFVGNEVVAKAIDERRVRFVSFSDMDYQRKAFVVVICAMVWPDRESMRVEHANLSEFALSPAGEWIETKEGERCAMFETPYREGNSHHGLAQIHVDRMELEKLKSKYINDMSAMAHCTSELMLRISNPLRSTQEGVCTST